MSKPENALLTFLRSNPYNNSKGFLKLTPAEFVLKHGWFYRPHPLPRVYRKGKFSECFKNAVKLIAQHDLIYCEGYAITDPEDLPIRHAWVTDGKGNALDSTWAGKGVGYAGVPFKSAFACLQVLKRTAYGSLIDDWERHWPLLRELSDRQEEWLEERGAGIKKLMKLRKQR